MTKRYLILFVALLSLAAWARQLTPQQALQRLNLNNARSVVQRQHYTDVALAGMEKCSEFVLQEPVDMPQAGVAP